MSNEEDTGSAPEVTHFVNVDLDVEGHRSKIAQLVLELDRKLLCLQNNVGRGGNQVVRYETRRHAVTADAAVRALVTAVEHLSTPARLAWSQARVRHFNVGVQAGLLPHASEVAIMATTLARVAAVDARLVFTVYAPYPRPS